MNDPSALLERVDKIDALIRDQHMRFSDPERFHLAKDEALRELGRLRKDLAPAAARPTPRELRARIASQNLARR